MGGGYIESLFTLAKENQCITAVGEVCGSMRGFKKLLKKKNQCLVHVIDGCLGTEKENDLKNLNKKQLFSMENVCFPILNLFPLISCQSSFRFKHQK